MTLNLGTVRPGSTIYIPFDTFAGSTGASITMTGLVVGDIMIYKDGGVTQRASTAGFTLLDTDGIDFDALTGIHGFSINLADNTTAGFYTAGSSYFVVVSTITIDTQTVSFVAATFDIGYPDAIINTTIATLSTQTSFTLTNGPAEDDALNGDTVIIHDIASAVQHGKAVVLDYTGSTKTVTLVAGVTFTAAAGDNISIFPPALQPSVWGGVEVVQTGDSFARIGATGSGLTSLATQTSVNTIDDFLDTEIAAIKAVTDVIPNAGALTTIQADLDDIQARIPAALTADGNIKADTLRVGGTLQTAGDIIGDTNDIQSRLPAALVGGRIDSSVGAMAANVVTAAAIADNAIDRATLAVDTGLQAIRSNTAQAGAAGTITLDASASASDDFYNDTQIYLTGGTGAGQARRIRDYVGATKVATVVPNWTTNPDATSTFAILPVTSAWDETLSDHLDSGSTGAALNAAGAAGDPWSTALPGAYGAGTAGKIVGDNVNATISSRSSHSAADVWAVTTRTLSAAGVQAIWDALTSALTTVGSIGKLLVDNINATISSRATQTSVDTVDDLLDTEVAAIKADTAAILADTGTDGVVVASGSKTGYALSAAGIQAIWDALTSALTTVGSIGKLIVDNLNATISSRSTLDAAGVRSAVGLASANLDTQLTAIDDAVDTEVAAVLAAVDTEVAAIKARTDNLPTDPADQSLVEAAITGLLTTQLTESYNADGVAPTVAQALTVIMQRLTEFSISGTTITVKKLDGATTAFTLTMDSATTPTSSTRAT